jgi:hypothetical protein
MEEARDPKKPVLSNNETKIIKIIFAISLIYITLTIFGIQLVSDEFKAYFKENGEAILSISILLFSVIVLFSIYGAVVDDGKHKKLKKQVTIESFNSSEYEENDITSIDKDKIASAGAGAISDAGTEDKFSKMGSNNVDFAFCQNNMSSLEKHNNCKKLTKNNCTTVGCCVLLNGEKCVGGNESGPTFLNEDGKDIDVQYYNHKNKCVGKGCPNI